MSKKRTVYGVGINDANYFVAPVINGKQISCPFYRAWRSMIKRSYDPKYHANQPTYRDCSVAPEWHLFSTFRAWMIRQSWEGNHLDKDIIIDGNKRYSPKNCCFVSRRINVLLNDRGGSRGEDPLGVCWRKTLNKFVAYCSDEDGWKHLGVFTTAEEAHKAFLMKKAEVIRKAVSNEPNLDPRAAKALLARANKMVTKCLEPT